MTNKNLKYIAIACGAVFVVVTCMSCLRRNVTEHVITAHFTATDNTEKTSYEEDDGLVVNETIDIKCDCEMTVDGHRHTHQIDYTKTYNFKVPKEEYKYMDDFDSNAYCAKKCNAWYETERDKL